MRNFREGQICRLVFPFLPWLFDRDIIARLYPLFARCHVE